MVGRVAPEKMTLTMVATCARGLESVLAEELGELGAEDIREERGALRFRGSHEVAYRVCLRSRIASRVLLRLGRFPVPDARALYDGVHGVDWSEHLNPSKTLRVDFVGISPQIRDMRFGAMKTKDAIVDRIRDNYGQRPDINVQDPDVRIRVHLRGGFGTVLLDLSGAPLFQRGWRQDAGPAPLKETLAAGLLRIAGWPQIAASGGALIDPMCGSGTFLIEGAEMALGRAAGRRRSFGFERWIGMDQASWERVKNEPDVPLAHQPQLFGSDISEEQLVRTRHHCEVADVKRYIKLRRADFQELTPPVDTGIIVTNPPYGERLNDLDEAEQTMKALGDTLRTKWLGWTAWTFAGSARLAKRIGLKPSEKHILFNGALECRFFAVSIRSDAPIGKPSWRQKDV